MQGVNLVSLDEEAAQELRQWYNGPTLADYLGELNIVSTLQQADSLVDRSTRPPSARHLRTFANPHIQRVQRL